MWEAGYNSVQTILRFRVVSNHLKIKTYKNAISPVVSHGCDLSL